MATKNSFQRLASLRPANTTEAKLYGPASGEEAVGEVFICNNTSSAAVYRIAITDTDAAATAADGDFIVFDKSLKANDTETISFHLANPHTIRVKSGTSDAISFVAMGNEITL